MMTEQGSAGGKKPDKGEQLETGAKKGKAGGTSGTETGVKTEKAGDPSGEEGKRAKDARSPRTALELMRRNVKTIQQLEAEAKNHRSPADRVAEGIARFCGSMTFVYVHAVFFAVWILVNTLPGIGHIDPYPFAVLTLAVSLEAIFLSTFILISQNHDMRISERRNHLDLQINMLTEQENTTMLSLLRQIATKIGIDVSSDPNINIMEETTNPKDLAGQIDRTMAKEDTK